jgi:hypothetical protein
MRAQALMMPTSLRTTSVRSPAFRTKTRVRIHAHIHAGLSATSLKHDLNPTEQGLQLSRLRQLTGLSDPVYAEAYVQVHVYDIVLDVLVINQVTPVSFTAGVTVLILVAPTLTKHTTLYRPRTRCRTCAWSWRHWAT